MVEFEMIWGYPQIEEPPFCGYSTNAPRTIVKCYDYGGKHKLSSVLRVQTEGSRYCGYSQKKTEKIRKVRSIFLGML